VATRVSAVAVLVFTLMLGGAAYGELAAIGPTNPANGFPLWVQDTNGVALELGLDPVYSIFDPIIVGNLFSEQIGFGEEAFFWTADASLDLGGGNQAILVLALEAAFSNGPPLADDQFLFGRVRIRIDTPVAGTYTVTHPFGTIVFPNVPAGTRAINFTSDIGGITPDFARVLPGIVGPYLVAVDPAPPLGFVGDPGILQTVTGSPTGNNFFRVEGPGGTVETDLFAVSGKLYTGAVPSPLIVKRASYTRATTGELAIFATSAPTAVVEVSGDALVPFGPLPMVGDGSGRFFVQVPLADPAVIPGTVSVTATVAPNDPITLLQPVVDVVTVHAVYEASTTTLTVDATSTDALVPPSLAEETFGALTNGQLVTIVGVPPSAVKVVSSAGGSASILVDVIGQLAELPPPPPVIGAPEPQLPPPPTDPPAGEVLAVSRLIYRTGPSLWNIVGTLTPAQAGVVVTARLSADLTGPVIGAGTTTANGTWRIAVRNSPVVAAPGGVASFQSSTGTTLLAVPITVRR